MKEKLWTFILLALLPLITFACPDTTANPAKSIAQIQKDITTFAISWNQGDIPAVLTHYKNTASTTLIWDKSVYGYKNIASYFKKTYPKKDEMGTLSTSHIKIELLSPQYAIVTGNWLVKNNNENKTGGPFSMLYENTSHGWKIILDHGSAAS